MKSITVHDMYGQHMIALSSDKNKNIFGYIRHTVNYIF